MSSFADRSEKLTVAQAKELMRVLEKFLDKYAPKEDAAEWEENAIKSKLANLLIAPEDYYELNDNAEGCEKKEHFTWQEAMASEEKVGKGWRLPTRHEWSLICEEFANDENGELSSEKLRKSLALSLPGYVTGNGNLYCAGTDGVFWSRTSYGRDSAGRSYGAYSLGLTHLEVHPQEKNLQSYGLSVRMVKEIHDE